MAYLDENEAIRVKGLTNNIIVIPVDMDKFNADITKIIQGELNNTSSTFKTYDVIAVIKDSTVVITNECVQYPFKAMTDKYLTDVYEQKEKEVSIIPITRVEATLQEFVTDYALPEMSLTQFMGDRFGYNTRIKSNTNLLLRDLKTAKNKK